MNNFLPDSFARLLHEAISEPPVKIIRDKIVEVAMNMANEPGVRARLGRILSAK